MIFSLLAAHSHRILEDSNDLPKIFKNVQNPQPRLNKDAREPKGAQGGLKRPRRAHNGEGEKHKGRKSTVY